MKERETQNPGATMDMHWMKTIQEKARTTFEQTREARKNYYDQRATPQPDIDIGLSARVFTPRLALARSATPSRPCYRRLGLQFAVEENFSTGHG